MSSDRLLTISSFGRAVRLPASALRHYAASGVLVPAEVDPASGYRFYAPDQLRQGVLVARLREARVPLPTVRQTLDLPPAQGAVLLKHLADDLAGESEARLRILEGIVADLQMAADDGCRRTVRVPGTVLARALEQVLLTSETAAAEVAGVVWDLAGNDLVLAATDRYWLAHHTLQVRSTGAAVSAFTGCDDTRAAASAVARRPLVEVTVSATQVLLRDPGHAVIASLRGGERAVPDLRLLLARQPSRRSVAGFPRRSLLQLLMTLAPHDATHLRITGDHATIGPAGSTGQGWASVTGGASSELLVRPSLLAVAVRASVGDEVLVGIAGAGDPLTITSPDQPQMTSLVMPMQA